MFGFSLDEKEQRRDGKKNIQDAVLGMAAFVNGEDDCPGVSVEGLADYEPVDIQLNAGMVRSILKAAEAVRRGHG